MDESTPGASEEINNTAGSILGFLKVMGPQTGWDLDQGIAYSIGNFWNVTRSQIYRELRDLVQRGFVRQGAPGPRSATLHEITPEGERAFSAWVALEPSADLIRLRILLTVFFGDEVDPTRMRDLLAVQRGRHEAGLARYLELQKEIGTESAMAMTLRLGINYERMMLEWIDSLPWT